MSTARHSPRPSRPCTHDGPSFSSSATKKKVPSLPLSLFLFLALCLLRFSPGLSPTFRHTLFLFSSCPVSAHRPRVRPPRLSGKPCREPLTVTKVPTYKRGLIPARGNSREHGHGNVRQGTARQTHRENCEADLSAASGFPKYAAALRKMRSV